MFHQPPSSATQLLRIRYWRTGLHRPQSREQCVLLGQALELSPEDMTWLLQYYYDSADLAFSADDAADPVYQERTALLQALAEEYMWKVPPHQLMRYRIPLQDPAKYVRHYFYRDAMEYIHITPKMAGQVHLESANFGGEFKKTIGLIGTVSRAAILRLLIVMNAPFLSVSMINEQLTHLGYAPLTPGHTNRSGTLIDDFVLLLLGAYEKHCLSASPDEALHWLKQVSRSLDRRAQENDRSDLRIFYFKSMK